MKLWYLCAVLALALMTGRIQSLRNDFKDEQYAHAQTRTALETALNEGLKWKLAAETAIQGIESMRETTQACLQREVRAHTDAEARKAILAPVQPRPRTKTEQQQVVDDETRLRAVTRLNRGL